MMKKMKEIFSVLLVVILTFNLCSVATFAVGEDIVVSIESVSAKRGDTVEVPITLTKNSGFVTMGLEVSYDPSVLEMVCPNHADGKNCKPAYTQKTDFGEDCGSNIAKNSQYHTVNPYKFMWAYQEGYDVDYTGEIVKITFKVKEDAPIGTTALTSIITQSYNADGKKNTFASTNGTVTVKCTDHIWGEWVEIKAPTCDETGEKNRTCTVCGEEETADIPVLTPDIVAEIGSVSAKRGDTVEVPIALTKNNGFATLGLEVSYDPSVLEMVCPEHEDGGFSCSPAIEKKIDFGAQYGVNYGVNSRYHTANPYKLMWAYISEVDVPYTGEIAKITFRVKEDAPFGSSLLTVTVTESAKADLTENLFSAAAVSGAVTVECAHQTDSGTVVTQPTCTEPGETVYKCSVCGAVMETEKAPAATGHIWGEWIVTKEPIRYDAGEKTRTCLLCGAYETSEFYPTSGACGVDLIWSLDTESGVLTISGSGWMDEYQSGYPAVPWYSQREAIQYVNIEDGVTTIGSDAFNFCYNLTGITIPDSVTTIGWGAFEFCSSLTSITIPNSVTTIADYAFYRCSNLESVTLGNSVTEISDSAFKYCSNLESVTLGNSVTEISDGAFYDCFSLTDIWYTGNESDKKGISIGVDNSALRNATWHYNCCSESMHTYDNACDAICNVCGYERSVPGHVYDNDCDATCNECGYERTVPDHVYDNACDAICNICGYIRQPDHVYDHSCDTTCNECGAVRSITHTYDNACDATCNICSYVREVPDHVYEYNSGHTCGICGYSKAPIAPVLESKTYNSVTLQKTEGFEYSKDGVVWQTDNVFSGLTENTVYTFYQRVKASDIAAQSEASDGLTVTVKRWQQTPAAPMILSYTDTTVVLVPTDGCEYSMDGEHWQNSNVFEGLSPASRYMFYQRRAETDSFEASPLSSAIGIVTDKSKQTAVPSAPALYHAGADSIILVLADGCEYSMDGVNWQSSNVFEGLSVATEYTFYQRYKETDTTYAGKSSPAALFQTDKGAQTAPSAPVLERRTNYRVILEAVPGYEYSRDGVNWQSSNVFEGLEPETTYLFYQRKAENDRYYASDISAPLTVKTPEMPGDANDDGKINLDDVVVLAQYVAEWDIECNEAALDVNGDGVVNLDDIVHLAQYVAEWEGIVLG